MLVHITCSTIMGYVCRQDYTLSVVHASNNSDMYADITQFFKYILRQNIENNIFWNISIFNCHSCFDKFITSRLKAIKCLKKVYSEVMVGPLTPFLTHTVPLVKYCFFVRRHWHIKTCWMRNLGLHVQSIVFHTKLFNVWNSILVDFMATLFAL